jgi:hypothetical protein
MVNVRGMAAHQCKQILRRLDSQHLGAFEKPQLALQRIRSVPDDQGNRSR